MNKTLFRLLIILSSLSFLGMCVAVYYMPALVPINWNLRGAITSFGPKWMDLFLGAIPLLVTLGLGAVWRVDPRRKNFQKHPKAYSIISAVMVAVFIGLSWAVALPALGVRLPVDKAISILIGIMFIGMGNYMPQMRSNFFMGFRTPWALSDDIVWQKTHRAGGLVFCIGGILLILSIFLPPPFVMLVPMGFILVGCVGVYIYSYFVYKALKS